MGGLGEPGEPGHNGKHNISIYYSIPYSFTPKNKFLFFCFTFL